MVNALRLKMNVALVICCCFIPLDAAANIGVCAPQGPPPLGPADPKVTSVAMAVFVIGLNHSDVAAGHPNVKQVENVAVRIKEAWQGDPARLVVLVSETGGCDSCGTGNTAFSDGSAQTVANKLHVLYKADFDVRRGFPLVADPLSVVASPPPVPAVIVGRGWKLPGGSSDSIGKDYASVSRFTDQQTRRYARVTIRSATTGLLVGLSVVHLTPDRPQNDAKDRGIQMGDLLSEARLSTADIDFVAGDFNQTITGQKLDGDPYPPEDKAWVEPIIHGRDVVWRSGSVKCEGADRNSRELFRDIMNLVVIGHGHRRTLSPAHYFFDNAADGETKEGTLRVPGIMHGVVGVTFTETCTPQREAHKCGRDDGCGQSYNNCDAGLACVAGTLCKAPVEVCKSRTEAACDQRPNCKSCINRCGQFARCASKGEDCPRGPAICPPEPSP